MNFFDSIPQPPPPRQARLPRPDWQQPDTVIPAWIPGGLMLISTGQAAVAIGGIGVYPNGFEFTVHVRMRGGDNESGWHDPFDRHGPRGGQPSADALRLGLLYADGRRGAAADSHRPLDKDAEPRRLIIDHQNSSGSDQRWDGLLWVYPLPPDGPVTFVAAWPAYGVSETRAELGGAAIRAAAARAVILWPEEPQADPGEGA